jgi:hypothetical protein
MNDIVHISQTKYKPHLPPAARAFAVFVGDWAFGQLWLFWADPLTEMKTIFAPELINTQKQRMCKFRNRFMPRKWNLS